MDKRQSIEQTSTSWALVLFVLCSVSSAYWISGPPNYIVLSGDIGVNYRIPEDNINLRVQLVEIEEDQERPLMKKDVPRNSTSGKILFPCGLVQKPGAIIFKLVTTGKDEEMARTSVINVSWPLAAVHVPLLVESYTSDVIVEVYLSSLECTPGQKGSSAAFVELLYEGPTETTEGSVTWHRAATPLVSKEMSGWLLRTSYEMKVECELFDRAGFYKIQVRTRDPASIVAESDPIQVVWSHVYSLSVPQTAILPCSGAVSAIYHYPRCTLDQDRIRVYGRPKGAGDAGQEYLLESRFQKGKHLTKIPCSVFKDKYQEFCLVYVSIARNGAVFEVATHCLPRAIDPGGPEALWATWSPWSQCSATCGSGMQNRYRLCNSPFPPKDGGTCEGKSVESQPCEIETCPEVATKEGEESPLMSSTCMCGCTLNVTERTVLASSLLECQAPVVWTVTAWPPDGHLTLDLFETNLVPDHQWVVVRDGTSPLGPVLAVVTGLDRPPLVQSVSSTIRLELQVTDKPADDSIVFRAAFQRIGVRSEELAAAEPLTPVQPSLSAVHVTLVVLAAVVLAATSVMLLLHQSRCFRSKKFKGSLRSESPCSSPYPEGESGADAHLLAAATSTSELSGSPLVVRREKRRPGSSYSPEDFLHNSFLFRSSSTLASPIAATRPRGEVVIVSSPTRSRLPVATVSPQPQVKGGDKTEERKPLKSALKQRRDEPPRHVVTSPAVRRRDRLQGRLPRNVQRESAAPLTEAVSELSITGSEDGFEYDYYDYGCHDVPGSFFCTDPTLMGWPPFIPIPPQSMEDLHFPEYTPSPVPSQVGVEPQSPKS